MLHEKAKKESDNATRASVRFGDHRLCDISKAGTQQYLLEKLKQGFAWETTNHLRYLLSKVMGTAVNWDYILSDPVRGVKMPEKTLKRLHRFLTAREAKSLVAASKEPAHAIILLAAMTGCGLAKFLHCGGGALISSEEPCSWRKPATKVTSDTRDPR